MSYTKENLQYANEILSSRKQQAEMTQTARRSEVADKVPEIPKYEAQLAQSGLAVVKALGMGANAQKYIEDLAKINADIQNYIKEALKKNGYPENYLEVPYTCKKCEDTGFVGGHACSCRKELLSQLCVRDLEAVSPAKKCRFDNFRLDYYPDIADETHGISPREKMEYVFEYCKWWAETFDKYSESLYMRGNTGLGKTHLSLAIANAVARSGHSVVYGSAQNILGDIERDKFSNYSKGNTERKVMDCDLLIIDDLGSEFSTSFTVSVLYNIINTRINTSKPVIISTNLDDTELESKYTQRVTSRIVGNYKPIVFMGNDIRQIKAES